MQGVSLLILEGIYFSPVSMLLSVVFAGSIYRAEKLLLLVFWKALSGIEAGL